MPNSSPQNIVDLLKPAFHVRLPMLDDSHKSAVRLFNGFLEGCPNLVVDLYSRTLVLHNYANPPENANRTIQMALDFYLDQLPWIEAVISKMHRSPEILERQGLVIHGDKTNREITEHGIRYAIDLTMNQDASFYIDTRNLRHWLKNNMRGKTVLNTFAYTGSLGVAAYAGGAARVIQTDLSRNFLNLAKTSYTLNGFPINKSDFITADFYQTIGRLKSAKTLFDCVILDPPFFSTTKAGKVDLVREAHRLINKARPLVNHNGWLITINNALFLKGKDYLQTLESLCSDGYLQIEDLLSVPQDITGSPTTRIRELPVDPSPFNHSTKIAILRVLRKNHSQPSAKVPHE